MSCATSERKARGPFRKPKGGPRRRKRPEKTGDRRGITLVYLYFLRKYSEYASVSSFRPQNPDRSRESPNFWPGIDQSKSMDLGGYPEQFENLKRLGSVVTRYELYDTAVK